MAKKSYTGSTAWKSVSSWSIFARRSLMPTLFFSLTMGCIFPIPKSPQTSDTYVKPGSTYDAVIGEPLGPRKNYDLEKELKDFFSCGECQASSDPVVMNQIIEKSTKIDFFTWVLREDGQLVLGKGPDEFMSHGVLATLNMKDQKATHGPMGRAYAGGEGYLDRSVKALYLSNKSGHYRPDFTRINNSVISEIFSQLVGQRFSVRYQDETKKPKPQPLEDPSRISTNIVVSREVF